MAGTQDNGDLSIDLATALGADAGVSLQCFRIYVPNKDQEGKETGEQRKWVLEAVHLLTELNGGATAMPQVEGTWRTDTGAVVWENPVVVYSFIRAEQFLANIARVREFLHRMGRETNQGEVACEFNEKFYRIRQFDPQEQP
jgi:hypothetical protein